MPLFLYVVFLLIRLLLIGNNTNENWQRTQADVSGALANGELLLQARIYPANDTGNATAISGLVNVTSDAVGGDIQLPYTNPDGSPVYLGQPGLGYPPSLYPNLTYFGSPDDPNYYVQAGGVTLNPRSVMIYGPLILDDESALLSATTGIRNNTNQSEILGWLTVIVNASMVYAVRDSEEGLGKTGEVLIIGPETQDNKYPFNIRTNNESGLLADQEVRFVLPPVSNASLRVRHEERADPLDSAIPFYAHQFPALMMAWTQETNTINNAGSVLSTTNEEGARVAVGYAQVKTALVDWVLIVEQSHGETVEPITHLRNILLICVFAVTGGLVLGTFPLAHYSVRPIRSLRAATRKTVEPYQPDDSQSGYSEGSVQGIDHEDDDFDHEEAKKEGFFSQISKWATNASPPRRQPRSPHARRLFRIPAKVPEKRHLIYDELTDLTTKFNEMSDELATQYQRLEERVKERTAELEQAKKVAESANQSKTLFIANISHELKTPLNGILGLAQICMNEDDPSKIKSTLNTIYKSGDLLLHLLTDLLTFSKNEVGQQLSIDESEFRLSDLSTQLMPTFDRQAKEAQVNLQVLFFGTSDSLGNTDKSEDEKEYGPPGTGRVRDMYLWGDKNRILQVLMNFTSNSLKFTPPHGSVTVRVKCLGVSENQNASRTGSVRQSSFTTLRSKTSSRKKVRTSDTSLTGGSDSEEAKKVPQHRGRNSSIAGSDSEDGGNKKSILRNRDGAQKLNINVGGEITQVDRIVQRQRSRSPPPINSRNLDFEFEVEDTGPGIPEDQQRKIFEPFVQGDLGLSKKYGGTGLGLSICAQLASLMGGELSLDSTVGKGSTFGMRIPLRFITERRPSIEPQSPVTNTISKQDHAQPQESSIANGDATFGDVPRVVGLSQPFVAKEVAKTTHLPAAELGMMKKAENEAARSGSKVRVLVAEDNKINQEVVLRMLKLEEIYDVTIAKDGQEAFDKVQESMRDNKHYHLIFMDVQMPNVDGIQSTKMIRNMGFSAPIVALTAFAEKSNEDECMASGMDYFLAKPIRRPALKQVLKKYCTTIPEEESDGGSPGFHFHEKPKVDDVNGSDTTSGRTCVDEQDSPPVHEIKQNGSILKVEEESPPLHESKQNESIVKEIISEKPDSVTAA